MGCVWAALRAGFITFMLLIGFELEPFGWFEGLSPPQNFVAFLGLSMLFAALLEAMRLVLPRTWNGFAIAFVGSLVAAALTVLVLAWLETRYDGANSPGVASTLWHYAKLLPFVLVASIGLAMVEMDDTKKPARKRKRLTLTQLLTPGEITGMLAMVSEQGKVRAFTDRGERLIDSRLVDAIADMPTADGLQIHRDWWVKRHAVTGFERKGKNVFLTLANGQSAPVGPAYAQAVRSAGLID